MEDNDHRNYFMIHLQHCMGPGRDQTCDPWICSQTSISSQLPSHRLRYMAGNFVSRSTLELRVRLVQ